MHAEHHKHHKQSFFYLHVNARSKRKIVQLSYARVVRVGIHRGQVLRAQEAVAGKVDKTSIRMVVLECLGGVLECLGVLCVGQLT